MAPKIIIMADDLDTLGGVQKFIDSLSRGLLSRGYDVELVSRFTPEIFVQYQRNGIRTTTIFDDDLRPALRAAGDKSAMPKARSSAQSRVDSVMKTGRDRLSRMIASWSSDTVVLVTQLGSLLELERCGLQFGTEGAPKVVAQYHGTYEYAAAQTYYKNILRLFPAAQVSLFLTRDDARRFAASGVTNSKVMVNAVEKPADFDPATSVRRNVVVSLGRYAIEKSLDELILAWSYLAQDFPDWSLDLYGAGPQEAELSDQIRDLGLTKSVSLKGLASSVSGVLSQAKIHAMTSHKEGFPVSLLEASVMHVPSVAYDAGPSTKEIIRDGISGYVVEEGTPDAFARSLAHLMRNENLRLSMARRAAELAERYDQDAILDKWEQLFREMSDSTTYGIPSVSPKGRDIRSKIAKPTDTTNETGKLTSNKMPIYDIRLQVGVKHLFLYFEGPARVLPEKAFAIKVQLFDEQDAPIDTSKTSLNWSSGLSSGFIYSPAAGAGSLVTLPMVKSQMPIFRIVASPIPWAIKKDPVVSELGDFYCETSAEDDGLHWYRIDIARAEPNAAN